MQVMPFADILDYAQFTAYIDPDALVATQENAIDLLEVRMAELGVQVMVNTQSCDLIMIMLRLCLAQISRA